MPSAPLPPPAPGEETLVERASAALERDILSGDLPPGSRLGVVGLVKRYGIGATPIREALSRLTSRDLIIAIGQRGFRVPPLERSDLADITHVRATLETEALRLSLEKGGDAWEAAILADLHQLKRYVERHGSAFGEGTEEFDRLHKAFHSRLVSASGSVRLTQAISGLYDQAYRYRRIMMKRFSDPDRFNASHEHLARRVLEREFGPARDALVAHIHSTLRYIYPEAESS
ncbi:MAG: GntR family transcriptional regulator [Rhizobiales bacterium 35-68-8]|nr:MAG: GntR family transcriptional regulator [Rhizobiales bacterium 35-68-8]